MSDYRDFAYPTKDGYAVDRVYADGRVVSVSPFCDGCGWTVCRCPAVVGTEPFTLWDAVWVVCETFEGAASVHDVAGVLGCGDDVAAKLLEASENVGATHMWRIKGKQTRLYCNSAEVPE